VTRRGLTFAGNDTLLEGGQLRARLREGHEYVLVPPESYYSLHEWYGGGPSIARVVTQTGLAQLAVDVYPLLLLRVCCSSHPTPHDLSISSQVRRFAAGFTVLVTGLATAPPVARTYTSRIALGSNLGGMATAKRAAHASDVSGSTDEELLPASSRLCCVRRVWMRRSEGRRS
jgi:hypothetical protein